jgi:hypothetical protein
MTPLELSHAELRAALILAGKTIRKYNKMSPVLEILRRVLRDARTASRKKS